MDLQYTQGSKGTDLLPRGEGWRGGGVEFPVAEVPNLQRGNGEELDPRFLELHERGLAPQQVMYIFLAIKNYLSL